MSEDVRVTPVGEGSFRVEVGGTEFSVTARAADVVRYGGGADAEDLVRASFRYLLDREPKSSILRSFDLTVIERYFPGYPREVRSYL